jgi:hypothetical protein
MLGMDGTDRRVAARELGARSVRYMSCEVKFVACLHTYHLLSSQISVRNVAQFHIKQTCHQPNTNQYPNSSERNKEQIIMEAKNKINEVPPAY